ncbi:MAG: hypothetical protein AAGF01_00400 [Cyanobacteria bacterium P01_G01_bin.38]
MTTGQDWRFGICELTSQRLRYRAQKTISQDLKLYRVPEELATLLSILVGITQSQPAYAEA